MASNPIREAVERYRKARSAGLSHAEARLRALPKATPAVTLSKPTPPPGLFSASLLGSPNGLGIGPLGAAPKQAPIPMAAPAPEPYVPYPMRVGPNIAPGFVPGTFIGAPQGTEIHRTPEQIAYMTGENYTKVPFSDKVLPPLLPEVGQGRQVVSQFNSIVKWAAELPEESKNTLLDLFATARGRTSKVRQDTTKPRVQTYLDAANYGYNQAKAIGENDATASTVAVLLGVGKFLVDMGTSAQVAPALARAVVRRFPRDILEKVITSEIPAGEINAALGRSGTITPRANKFVQGLSKSEKVDLGRIVQSVIESRGPGAGVSIVTGREPTALGRFAGYATMKTLAPEQVSKLVTDIDAELVRMNTQAGSLKGAEARAAAEQYSKLIDAKLELIRTGRVPAGLDIVRSEPQMQLPGLVRRPGQASPIGLSTEELGPAKPSENVLKSFKEGSMYSRSVGNKMETWTILSLKGAGDVVRAIIQNVATGEKLTVNPQDFFQDIEPYTKPKPSGLGLSQKPTQAQGSESLLSEAAKYDTPEEFVRAQSPARKFYRGGSDSEMPRGTADDVLKYEREELGNADVIPVKGIDLTKIDAKNTMWVTETKKAAKEYGPVKDIDFGEGQWRVLARDNDGGLLIERTNPSQLTSIWEQAHGKRPTQAQQVKGVLKQGPQSIKQVAAQTTNIPEPTIRRILGQGTIKGDFERVAQGVYRIKSDTYGDVAIINAADALDIIPKVAEQGFKADAIILDIPYAAAGQKASNRDLSAYELITPEQFGKFLEDLKAVVRNPDTPLVYFATVGKSSASQIAKYRQKVYDAGYKKIGETLYEKITAQGKRTNMGRYTVPAEKIELFNISGKQLSKEKAFPASIQYVPPFLRSAELYQKYGQTPYKTEKPEELAKDIVERTTQPGETLLDPFAGSGVFPAEAVRAGRRAVAIEKNPEQAKKAAERVARVTGLTRAERGDIRRAEAEARRESPAGQLLSGKYKLRPPTDTAQDWKEVLGPNLYGKVFSGGPGAMSIDEFAQDIAKMSENDLLSAVEQQYGRKGAPAPKQAPIPVRGPGRPAKVSKEEELIADAEKNLFSGNDSLEDFNQIHGTSFRSIDEVKKLQYDLRGAGKASKARESKVPEFTGGVVRPTVLSMDPEKLVKKLDKEMYREFVAKEKAAIAALKMVRQARKQITMNEYRALVSKLRAERRGALAAKRSILGKIKSEAPRKELIKKLVQQARGSRAGYIAGQKSMDMFHRALKSREVTIASIRKRLKRITESPSIPVPIKRMARERLQDFDVAAKPKKRLLKAASKEQADRALEAIGVHRSRPFTMSENEVMSLLARGRLDVLPIEELNRLVKELDIMEVVGRQAIKDAKAREDAELDAIMEKLQAARGGRGKLPPRPGALDSEMSNFFWSAKRSMRSFGRTITPIDLFFERLDNYAGYLGPFITYMKQPIDMGMDKFVFDEQLLKEMEALIKTEHLDGNASTRIALFSYQQSSVPLERLLVSGPPGRKFTEKEAITPVKLTESEKRFVEWYAEKDVEEIFRRAYERALETDNIELEFTNNYIPFQRNYDLSGEDTILTAYKNGKRYKPKHGFQETREPNARSPLNADAFDVYRKHIRDVYYYYHMAPALKRVKALNDKLFEHEIINVEEHKFIAEWLDHVARRGTVPGFQPNLVTSWILPGIAARTLGFSLQSMLIQASSFSSGAGYTGMANTVWGAEKAATSKEWRKLLFDRVPQVRFAGADDPAWKEMLPVEWMARMQKIGYAPMQALDKYVRATTVLAGIRKYYALRGQYNVKPENVSDDAIQYANRLLNRAQNSFNFKDLAPIITRWNPKFGGRTIAKSLMYLQSFNTNQLTNMVEGIGNIAAGRVRQGMSILAGAVGNYFSANGLRGASLWLRLHLGFIGLIALVGNLWGVSMQKAEKYAEKKMKQFQDEYFTTVGIDMLQSLPILSNVISMVKFDSEPVAVVDFAKKWVELVKRSASALTNKNVKRQTLLRLYADWLLQLGGAAGIPGTQESTRIILKMPAEALDAVKPFKL